MDIFITRTLCLSVPRSLETTMSVNPPPIPFRSNLPFKDTVKRQKVTTRSSVGKPSQELLMKSLMLKIQKRYILLSRRWASWKEQPTNTQLSCIFEMSCMEWTGILSTQNTTLVQPVPNVLLKCSKTQSIHLKCLGKDNWEMKLSDHDKCFIIAQFIQTLVQKMYVSPSCLVWKTLLIV